MTSNYMVKGFFVFCGIVFGIVPCHKLSEKLSKSHLIDFRLFSLEFLQQPDILWNFKSYSSLAPLRDVTKRLTIMRYLAWSLDIVKFTLRNLTVFISTVISQWSITSHNGFQCSTA